MHDKLFKAALNITQPRFVVGVRFDTIKAVVFLIAGKLDFRALNPHAPQPT